MNPYQASRHGAPVVVSLHSDIVTERGDTLEVIASADHAAAFGTRHQTAPLWTVHSQPEIAPSHHNHLVRDFGWQSERCSFADVTTDRVFESFTALVTAAMG